MPKIETLNLSASRGQDFISCPFLYFITADQRIQRVVTSDVKRIGSNWHKIQEIVGNEKDPKKAWEIISAHLNRVYEHTPDHKTTTEWETERNILLYTFAAYIWYYGLEQHEQYDVIATEIKFKLPLLHPITGNKLRACRKGMIDVLVRGRRSGLVFIADYKSTSSSVDPDSSFWDTLRMDLQPSMYLDAALELQRSGELEKYGIMANDQPIAGVLFDVWRKPGIKPKKITQAETAEFIKTGMYCGMKFKVESRKILDYPEQENEIRVTIDGNWVGIIHGKKEGTFAIRETPNMFGARLYQEIIERPEFYFARREIARTDKDMQRFRTQQYGLYQTIRSMRKNNSWYGNPKHCEATYHCDFRDICYRNIDVLTEPLPEGFERWGGK